jgi:hypothetical protein
MSQYIYFTRVIITAPHLSVHCLYLCIVSCSPGHESFCLYGTRELFAFLAGYFHCIYREPVESSPHIHTSPPRIDFSITFRLDLGIHLVRNETFYSYAILTSLAHVTRHAHLPLLGIMTLIMLGEETQIVTNFNVFDYVVTIIKKYCFGLCTFSEVFETPAFRK